MDLRREEGQIIPALVVIMLTLVAFGMLFFQVGRASVFRTQAQTGADAAALAAAKDVRAQLMEQLARHRDDGPRADQPAPGARGR